MCRDVSLCIDHRHLANVRSGISRQECLERLLGASSHTHLVEAERAGAGGGREAGIRAARDRVYERALSLMRQGRFAEAEPLFHRVLDLAPDSSIVRVLVLAQWGQGIHQVGALVLGLRPLTRPRRGGGAVKAAIPSELAICQSNLLGSCGQPNLTHGDAQTRGNNPPPALQSPLPQREGIRGHRVSVEASGVEEIDTLVGETACTTQAGSFNNHEFGRGRSRPCGGPSRSRGVFVVRAIEPDNRLSNSPRVLAACAVAIRGGSQSAILRLTLD